MTQLNIDTSAQTDVNAIASLLNQTLQPQGIAAKAALKDVCLQIMLESAQVPDRQLVVPLIRARLVDLGIQSGKKVKIYGRQIGEDFPDWQHEFDLEEQVNLPLLATEAAVEVQPSILIPELEQEQHSSQAAQVSPDQPQKQKAKKTEQPSIWGSMFGAVAGAIGAVGGATVQAGQVMVGTAVGTAGAVGGAVAGTAGAIGGAAVQASQGVVGTAVGVGGAITSTALQTPEGLGHLLGLVGDSPQLQQLTKAVQVD